MSTKPHRRGGVGGGTAYQIWQLLGAGAFALIQNQISYIAHPCFPTTKSAVWTLFEWK